MLSIGLVYLRELMRARWVHYVTRAMSPLRLAPGSESYMRKLRTMMKPNWEDKYDSVYAKQRGIWNGDSSTPSKLYFQLHGYFQFLINSRQICKYESHWCISRRLVFSRFSMGGFINGRITRLEAALIITFVTWAEQRKYIGVVTSLCCTLPLTIGYGKREDNVQMPWMQVNN